MKKLVAIIIILLLVFIILFTYKSKSNASMVNAEEVEQIQDYISKIYMWKEVTGEALPTFDNINNAQEKWVWETVKKNLENTELTYDDIANKAKELYGNDFKKEFPKEGTGYLEYDEQTGKYLATGTDLDSFDDSFLIEDIEKTDKGYTVKIAEYIVDYSNSATVDDSEISANSENTEEPDYDVYVENLNKDIIATVKSSEIQDGNTKIIEAVKQNEDKFTNKTLSLKKDADALYVESVK